jgi:hypothetical protein
MITMKYWDQTEQLRCCVINQGLTGASVSLGTISERSIGVILGLQIHVIPLWSFESFGATPAPQGHLSQIWCLQFT